jgi:hypothetical protein
MITPIQTIKARRVTRMTEADLSAASGVSQKAIEEFEAAKRSLNATTVQADTFKDLGLIPAAINVSDAVRR